LIKPVSIPAMQILPTMRETTFFTHKDERKTALRCCSLGVFNGRW